MLNSSFFRNLRQAFKRYGRHVQPDRRYLFLTVLFIFGIAVSNTAMIWLIGTPFSLIQRATYEGIGQAMFWLAITILVNQSLHFLGLTASNWLGLRMVGRLRNAVTAHALQLSFPVVDARFQRGDLLARLSNDADRVQFLILETPFYLVSHLFTLVFYTVMIIIINVKLALVASVFIPLFVLHQIFFASPKRRASEHFFQRNGKLLALEEQVLSHLRGISSGRLEVKIGKTHADMFERARYWVMRMRYLDNAFNSSLALLVYGCGLAVVAVGVMDVRNGVMELGALVSFLLYLGFLSVPVRGFAQAPFQCQEGLAAVSRINEVMEAAPLVQDKPGAPPLQVGQGRIELVDVSFRYPDGPQVLQSINVKIEPGQTIALVGPSGAGKSTLAQLLLRFYDPDQGGVLIDGQNIREVSLASLRSQIGMVWQEPFIMDGTIRENLQLVVPQATDAAMQRALRAAHAWEFVQGFEQGLDSLIGTGARTLSTGQRQRLTLAQAFLRDTPILILDEASSGLDSQSEQKVVEAISQLRQGRTTLMIAHRYSSIRSADCILYINGDGSVTLAKHEDLLNSHPGYRDAVHWQAGVSEK